MIYAILLKLSIVNLTASTEPKFMSLKSKLVNLHIGPGLNYPVNWIYTCKGLPIEVMREFGIWRYTRDHNGDVGWIHKKLLSEKRYVLIVGNNKIFENPNIKSPIAAFVESGITAQVIQCNKNWCNIIINKSYKGWIKRRFLWGIYPQEMLSKKQQ